MALISNALSSLISLGNDAMSNLFEVKFSGGIFDEEDKTRYTVRCSDFSPQSFSQDTYNVNFVTASIPLPKAKVNISKKFTLKFRVDSSWLVYKKLLEQQKYLMDVTKSYVNIDINSLRDSNLLFDVQVNRIKNLSTEGEGVCERLYNYKGCWIDNISVSEFNTNSEPVSVSCSIKFLEAEDWQSGLTSYEEGDESHINGL